MNCTRVTRINNIYMNTTQNEHTHMCKKVLLIHVYKKEVISIGEIYLI
jgi:hypothetical protein